jgi:diguanylate cyclase (GGDEF)-like protein
MAKLLMARGPARRAVDTHGHGSSRWLSTLLAIVVIAAVTRVAAAYPPLCVVGVATLVIVSMVFAARSVSVQRSRSWRSGWLLLGVALVFIAAASVLRVVDVRHFGDSATPQLLANIGNAIALAGLATLVRHRARGRAIDALLEAGVIAGAGAYVVWAMALTVADVHLSGGALLALSLDAAAAWVAARLLAMGPDRPRVVQFLLAGWIARLGVKAIAVAAPLLNWPVTAQRTTALALWTFGLWAAAAIHPSLRRPFDTATVRDSRDVPARAALLGTVVLIVPLLAGVQALSGSSPRVDVLVVGATSLPLAVVLRMSYQLFERARAEYVAQHDALTGLPNRNMFLDRLNAAVVHSERSDERFAVMFLDLDRFKTINDSLGHAAGNQLLQQVARRIRVCLRESDTLARLGGDEFTILVNGVDEDGCAAVAQKVLDSFGDAFAFTGRTVFTSTSIGIATFPENGPDAEALLKHADTAMYQAKSRGRNSYEFYSSDMSARATVKLSLETSLHSALERGQLTLHFQPQVSMVDGQLVGPRGARSMEASTSRLHLAVRIHSARRRVGTHRAARRMGVGVGVPPPRRMACRGTAGRTRRSERLGATTGQRFRGRADRTGVARVGSSRVVARGRADGDGAGR